MKPIIIKKYDSEVVFINEELYNVNNCYLFTKQSRPDDYFTKIDLGNTKNWIYKFHTLYHTITFDSIDLKWMNDAYFKIGATTLKFSHLYDDELIETVNKYNFPPGKWFVRSEHASLKYGMYGAGPYDNLTNVVKSMVSSIQGHGCFRENDQSCTIYLLPWIEMNPDKEFRVFVYKNEITAISTQSIYSPNRWLSTLATDEIKTIINNLLEFFYMYIQEKMKYMENYTMDIALLDNGSFYFIEPNSFGENYAAGSALFHWITDRDVLYQHDSIEFRYT